MLKRMGILCAAVLLAQPAIADDRAKLAGLWNLVSFDTEFQDTNERKPMYGKNPKGHLVLLPEGRMMALIPAEGRKVPKTDEDRLAAFRTMFAYSGIYRLEGDKWVTKVDVAWNEAWTGTDQTRFYKFDGPRLLILTAWQPSVNIPGRTTRGILTWERAK